jgi:hypothetical protein
VVLEHGRISMDMQVTAERPRRMADVAQRAVLLRALGVEEILVAG